jgi:hypothetical protein
MAFSLNISSVISKLNKDANKLLEQVDNEIYNGLEEVVLKAKAEAPNDFRGEAISSTINVERTGLFEYSLNATNPYAAYYEFGTGPSAQEYLPKIEQEWVLIASDYIKNKKGTIKESAYLYPSYNSVMPRVFDKIQKELNA